LIQAIHKKISQKSICADWFPARLNGAWFNNPQMTEFNVYEIPIFTILNLTEEVNRAAIIPMKPSSPQQTDTPKTQPLPWGWLWHPAGLPRLEQTPAF
jgi:hypothetical protein